MAIAGLARGLGALGHEVEILRPENVYRSLDLTRLAFNATLRPRLRRCEADLVVGFDLDGCLLSPEEIPGRYVVSLKGVRADEERFESGLARLRFGLLTPLEARNARSSQTVVCTSAYSAERAAACYGISRSRLRVVPEGIDVEAWSGLASRGAAARAGRTGALTILTVARQYRRKNTRSLLDAFAVVRRTRPAARLRIVGDGPELPSLRRRAHELGLGDSAVFVGSVRDMEALQREYEQADLFCLPSRQEGFGIVFLEAMSAGLPIVAARAGAVPDVAPHGEVSLLVDPDDTAALAGALETLIAAPDLRRELGRAGVTRFARFDWPVVAGQFLSAALR